MGESRQQAVHMLECASVKSGFMMNSLPQLMHRGSVGVLLEICDCGRTW